MTMKISALITLSVAFLQIFISPTLSSTVKTPSLFDMPVSNHGARIRMILKEKGIGLNELSIVAPSTIGGLKSAEYLSLNPQGKMPLLITEKGTPLPESDVICRYLLARYKDRGPSFQLRDLEANAISDLVSRIHDVNISPIQGAMYRAPGMAFGTFGSQRKPAMDELLRQFKIIEDTLITAKLGGPFLCGDEISLADATLFPTCVFSQFMLPQFFCIAESDYLGPRLREWWRFMSSEVRSAAEVKQEIEDSLEGWKKSDRWVPILEEWQRVKG